MRPPARQLEERVARLRADFDRAFALPPPPVAATEDLLGIGAAGRPYALRLSQTAGCFPDRPVTRLPGPLAALTGVAGCRGAPVPVFDLGALLGHHAGHGGRWLVLVAGKPAVALRFERLDGHLRVPAGAVLPEAPGGAAAHRPCLDGLVILPDGPRDVVDLPAVRAAIQILTAGADEEE